jgi:two-component system CheB/CheR fusion protein
MSEEDYSSYENLAPDTEPVTVVAIGGSAGGQQAVTELLKNLPPDTGLAFVYIQHLSPEHDSLLPDILGKVTPMTVLEAEPLMPVKPNHLYIIPPNKEMEITDGVLVLSPRKPRPHIHLPIDQFFISLAERQKDGAIGIVLSGMASDGTEGLKAIKVAGGITFAQDETAEYPGMPQSAINEGVVDRVLSPKDIASELVRLSQHAGVFQLTNETGDSAQEDASDKDLAKILALVKSSVGMDFVHYKKSTIRRRITRRMLLYKLDTLAEYGDYLIQHPAETDILYNDLLINVTSFFRDEQTMEYLKKQILPAIIKNKAGSDPLRFWVAACSTGQEAYSLAMILMEILGDRAASIPIQIFATDLSESAIAKARLGMFTKSEVKDIDTGRLNRFFTKTDDHYRINKPVRDLCVFAPHNLLTDPPFSRLDMVTCRNLLIYLDDVLQKKILTTFHYSLNPGGVLVLGKSEAVGSSPSHFTQIEKEYKIFARKNNLPARIPTDMSLKRSSFKIDKRISISKSSEILPANELDKLVDTWLLSNYVPASIIVDQDLEILQFRGATSLFLEHASGKASLNLSKLVRPSLVFELRNAIHKARKTSQPAGKEGAEIVVDGKVHYVSIKAVPITNPANQQLFLILFEEMKENAIAPDSMGFDADKRNLLLESELAALRQDMHSIIEEQEASNEELQSANEEIVSSNEELQSINEELETSKEEIESANEELQTINQELQVRNDQLSESYEYSEAILSTINEATLVLDDQLRIKAANKAFYKVFQTDPNTTEGSTIYELGNRQIDFNGFSELMHNLINRNAPVTGYEIKMLLGPGNERTMRINATKVILQRKQTILLVFEDITEHRKAQNLLKERQQWFEELVDNATALIWVASPDGKISYLNKAWVDFTGQAYQAGNAEVVLESIHPDDRDAYLELSSKSIREQTPYNIEYRLRRWDGEYQWVLENTKSMVSTDGQFSGYIGTCTNVHLQKTLTQQLNLHVEERTRELKKANSGLETANLELRRTADRLRSVLNGVPAAVTLMEAIYAPDGSVTDFVTSIYNDVTLELTGLSASDLTDKTVLQWYPDFREAGLFELYTEVLTTGNPAYREVTGLGIAPDKTVAFLITRQVDLTGIVVTVLDITNRKQAEMKLVQTAESLQAVLDSSRTSIGFFKGIYDESGMPTDFYLIICNRKFSTALGWEVGNVIGKKASELYNEERLAAMIQTLIRKERIYQEIFIEADQKWVGLSISQHDSGIAVTEMDISELRQAKIEQDELIQQLNGSFEMIGSLSVLKEYVQQRGSFLRSTFHDLRGSFGIISGATSLLNIMETEEDRKKTLDMIQRNLSQVTQMMNQVLDFSRLESGQEKLEITTFNVSDLLTQLSDGSASMANAKNLWLRYEGPQELIVQGDPVKIRRIAQNLLLNALRYTHEGGVTVSWTKNATDENGMWQFDVQDTGPGIPARIVKSILNVASHTGTPAEFQEEEKPEDSNAGKGEGIGLFITKHLVRLLNGRLEIETSSTGTIFIVSLPQVYHS